MHAFNPSEMFFSVASLIFFFFERVFIIESVVYHLASLEELASSGICLFLLPRPRSTYLCYHVQTQTWVFMTVQEALYILNHLLAPEAVLLTTIILAFYLILVRMAVTERIKSTNDSEDASGKPNRIILQKYNLV